MNLSTKLHNSFLKLIQVTHVDMYFLQCSTTCASFLPLIYYIFRSLGRVGVWKCVWNGTWRPAEKVLLRCVLMHLSPGGWLLMCGKKVWKSRIWEKYINDINNTIVRNPHCQSTKDKGIWDVFYFKGEAETAERRVIESEGLLSDCFWTPHLWQTDKRMKLV